MTDQTDQAAIDPIYYTCTACKHVRDDHKPGWEFGDRVAGCHHKNELGESCDCREYQVPTPPQPDPLANDPRAQVTRQLVKERGVVSSEEIDEYMREMLDVTEEGVVTLAEGVSTEQFMAQIQNEMEIPRPDCICGHTYKYHKTTGRVIAGCWYEFLPESPPGDPDGHVCPCLQYEPKQFDEEPTGPVNPEAPFNDMLDAFREVIRKYHMGMQESVDFLKEFSESYVEAWDEVPKPVPGTVRRIWEGYIDGWGRG